MYLITVRLSLSEAENLPESIISYKFSDISSWMFVDYLVDSVDDIPSVGTVECITPDIVYSADVIVNNGRVYLGKVLPHKSHAIIKMFSGNIICQSQDLNVNDTDVWEIRSDNIWENDFVPDRYVIYVAS